MQRTQGASASALDRVDLAVLQREKEKWLQIQVASASHRMRTHIPAIDTNENPFCQSRRLRDAVELHELNKVRLRVVADAALMALLSL
jgi:hypothetical protein